MSRHVRLYPNAELRHRPLEHILEDLTCDELGAALGVSRTAAWELQRGMLTPRTDGLINEQTLSRLRTYLERG